MNPSDNSSQAPCGTCDRPVTWSDRGIVCETCGLWYHASCQSIGNPSYDALNSSARWDCEICGSPNYSTIAFDLHGISHNSHSFVFESCNDDDVFTPLHCSTPTRHSRQNKSNKRPLRVLVVNFRSAVGKIGQILHLIESTQPDIILGCETWMDETVKSNEIFPPEYKVFRKDRNRNGGGVLIATKDNILCTVESNLNVDNCEILWIKIKVKGSRDLLLASYYRPDAGDGPSVEAFNESLKFATRTNCAIFVGGDLNFPGFEWSSGSIKKNSPYPTLHQYFLDTISDHGLEQLVDKPTRENNTLDLLLTNSPSLVPRVEIIPGISDHAIVYAEIQTQPARTNQGERVAPCYRKADWTGLRAGAKTLSDNIVQSAQENTPDVEDTWKEFKDGLRKLVEKFIPHVKIKKKKNVPWISGETLRLIRKRDRIHHKWKRTGRQDLKDAFKKLKTTIQRLLRREYWLYINSLFIEPTKNSDKPTVCKRLWTYIKSKKTENSGISSLKIQGKLITDDKEIAEALNNQFQSVFSKKENLTKEEFYDRCAMPPVDPPRPPCEDIVITTSGVQKLLQNLDPAKASGPDGISPRVLKELAAELAPALAVLYQASLDSGIVPADWRTALVAPIFKKGERYKPENYRPISLTSIPCKLLEHIVVSHVMGYCDEHNVLCREQHGFRSGHSCESQLLGFIDEVTEDLEQGHQVDLLVMDFSKAFDKVSHTLLTNKLNHYGISGKTNQWIGNFLAERQQAVVVNGVTSSFAPVESGVPQGSVLGPSLFLLYINDLPTDLCASARLFADDTACHQTIYSEADQDSLQADLDKMATWESKWKMEFHPQKCSTVHINKGHTTSKRNYKLRGHTLEEENNVSSNISVSPSPTT